MRRGTILIIGLLAALIAIPTAADARRGGGPGIIFNTLTSPMKMIARGVVGRRVAHRTRHHRKVALNRHRRSTLARSSSRRSRETAALAVPVGQIAGAGARSAGADPRQHAELVRTQPPGWAGPLYWPHASDALFDHVFGPAADGERFW